MSDKIIFNIRLWHYKMWKHELSVLSQSTAWLLSIFVIALNNEQSWFNRILWCNTEVDLWSFPNKKSSPCHDYCVNLSITVKNMFCKVTMMLTFDLNQIGSSLSTLSQIWRGSLRGEEENMDVWIHRWKLKNTLSLFFPVIGPEA